MPFTDLTQPDHLLPCTIDGLLAAYREGTLAPGQVIGRLWTSWLASGWVPPEDPNAAPMLPAQDPVWISRCTAAHLQAQLDALADRALQAQSGSSTPAHPVDLLPLYGIPFAVKDNIDVAGLFTTAACPEFAQPGGDTAEAVRRLMAAGAIVVGKTNLDQFATGLVGQRSPYGAPTSTFSADHVSGGSSSGSAVAVARGEVPFALGTDTAGSGRVPAGFNNLVGLKPTPGLVPTHGVLPACKSLDCVSVFALTAHDAARVLAVMAGPMAGQPAFPSHAAARQPGLPHFPRALRVGLPAQTAPCDDAPYASAFERAQLALPSLSGFAPVSTRAVDLAPLWAVARLLYDGPWVAERYAAIANFIEQHPLAVHPVVGRILQGARKHDAIGSFMAQYRLQDLAAQIASLWDDIDVLMVPTAPTLPTQASVEADPIGRNSLLGSYTNFVNLLGWSALAVPAGFTPEGLPFGVTFIAPGGRDAALLELGARWQAMTQRLSLEQPEEWPHETMLGCRLPAPAPEAWDLPPLPSQRPPARPTMPLAVVGAHLAGMPLHGQLVERQARLLSRTRTAPAYRLFALPGTVPPKPGLARLGADELARSEGASIEVEVYEVPQDSLGSFLALIPPPLGLGSVELADGRWVKGFICEPAGLVGAHDISHLGGWRAYMASLASKQA
jgi:allophanate hydrolase